MNIRTILSDHIREAMTKAGVPEEFRAHVALSKNPKFGDYQANGAMAAAKAMRTNPRDLAQQILDHVALDGIAEKIEIAGPGFINIHLDQAWLAASLSQAANDERLNISATDAPQTVVIDYSSPNLAKEMHVGHLRSTIIGDAIARVLEFTGDKVIRQNHVGDWGTQFGMLIAELELHLSDGEQAELALEDLESFYKQAKAHKDESDEFADICRGYVVKLQSGDEKILELWEKFREVSLKHSSEVYKKLNVTLSESDVYGESAYNDDLSVLVSELLDSGIAEEDDEAIVVVLPEFLNKDGNPMGVIIQKKGGGFLYTTTDLAAIRYRTNSLKANRLLYFIDERQSQHMQQVFTIANKAKYVDDTISLEHHAFGMMLNKDGKPFATRDGGTVKLVNLLNEAISRAEETVRENNSDFSEEEIKEISNNVGIGAIKYADLSKTRTNDYIFDWEKMLSFEGNTGPYMQYAYARSCSVFRNASLELENFNAPILIGESQERSLTLKLLQLPEVISQVSEDAYPHTLCSYLYDLAKLYSTFYEACPILKDGVEEATKLSRLQLCKATAKTLELGLGLLGIKVMERM